MVQRDISLNDNLEKLAKEAQQLALEKEKQDWKFNCWFDKKRKLRFEPKDPLLTGDSKILVSHHFMCVKPLVY